MKVNQNNQVPILGKICWWSLKDVKIDRNSLENLFNSYNLDKKFLPPIVSGKKAFIRTLKEIQKSNLVRKIKEDEKYIIFGIVKEEVDPENIKLEFETQDIIFFDKENKEVFLKLNKLNLNDIKDLFDYFKIVYIAEDIRKVITRFLDHINAVLLRKTGGIYFVPKDYALELEKISGVINNIGNSEFYELDIVDSEATKRQAIKLIKSELERNLKKEAENLETLLDNPEIRPSSISRAIERYKNAKEKLEMYKSLLQFAISDIEQELNEIEKRIKDKLIGQIQKIQK